MKVETNNDFEVLLSTTGATLSFTLHLRLEKIRTKLFTVGKFLSVVQY